MEKHIKALGIVFLVFGLLGTLVVLMLLVEISDLRGGEALGGILLFILVVIAMIFAIPLVIAGYGLIKLRRWSRIFGIIISSISLLYFPFGTAIGAYGLWVLTRSRTKEIFHAEFLKKYLKQSPESEVTNDLKEQFKQSPNNVVSEPLEKKEVYDMDCYDKGEEQFELKHYQEAFKYFIKVAQQGYPDAQNYIGYMYLTGNGTNKDDNKAFEWYQNAAVLGHAPSQYSLGYMYHQGISVNSDLVKAKEWFKKASDQGHEEAKQSLNEIQ